METIILVALAFIIGWKINEFILAASFKKILEDLNVSDQSLKDLARKNGIGVSDDDPEEKPQGPEIQLKIESIDGGLLAYDSQDTFVAQAPDADTLLSRIIELFPAGTRITVLKEHGGDLITEAAERMKSVA
jgi:hypothetical protein